MAFRVEISGADSLDDGEKAAFERHLVEEVRALVSRLEVKPGVNVNSGKISVDTLDPVSFGADDELIDAPIEGDDG